MYVIEISKDKAESMVEHLTKATKCLTKAIQDFNEVDDDEFNERLPRRGYRDEEDDDERMNERYGRRGGRSGMRSRYSRY